MLPTTRRDLSHLEAGDPARQAALALIRRINQIRRERGWKTYRPKGPNSPYVGRLESLFGNDLTVDQAISLVESWAGSPEPGYHTYIGHVVSRLEDHLG